MLFLLSKGLSSLFSLALVSELFAHVFFFSVSKIISGINIFQLHATIYFVQNPFLG
jgi:hypothetical protein